MKNKLAHLYQQLLACIAVALFLAMGMQTVRAAGSDANSVQSLDYSTLEDGKLLIKVGLKQPLKASPAGFAINNPPRVVLDLAGASNGLGKNTVNVGQGALRNINIVQAGDRTRLVMNLSKAAQYTTRIEGNDLFITLQASNNKITSNETPRFAEGAPSAAKHSVRDIDFHRGSSGEGRIVTTLSDTTTGIDIRKQGQQLVVDFLNTDVPRSLQRRLDVNDFATPVKFIETQSNGGNVRMIVEPKGDYEYSAYQADNQFTIEVRAKQEESGKTGSGKPKYTGDKLSLNFQNVEVRSVLQVIADFTGLNIITSDTVNGNLTLRLKDVPWDQALDIIMQSKGLDKRVNGNVIWIAPKDELVAKEKAELESRQATQALEPLVVRSYELNYMRAEQAARVLQGQAAAPGDNGEDVSCSAQAQGVKATPVTTTAAPTTVSGSVGGVSRILSSRGSASSEPQTNSLIVSDTPSKQDEVRELLKLIDIPAKQVMIEARVVVADDGFSRQLGVRFGVQHGRKGDSVGVSNSAANAASGITSGVNGAAPFNVDLPAITGGAAAGTLGLSLINLGSGNLVSLELSALEADNRGKIISNPRVVTSNQRPAVILQGTQIPYITPGTANSPPTVTFKDAFLCLLVNPQILNNDSVILNVEVQKDAVGASTAGNPAIDTKRVKTQVRLKNGETAVLGGIYEQSVRTDVNKVPLLGDIPVFGNLFKTTNKQDGKTELLIFLTPRIIKDNMELR
ncbi:type IV pilus secretin PilQ [Sulfuriferula sp. GW1]|uniref:type IV pilus secretin PilQ n=1 Tax=Sulfuriferula sp. GW1 TaxID=3345111 RepID=UPI0039AED86C